MGHSFGGITSLSAGQNIDRVKAIISLDPWYFPFLNHKDELKPLDKKTLILMTENWDKELTRYADPNYYKQSMVEPGFLEKCKEKPTCIRMKDQWHCNMFDGVIIDPVGAYS